MARVVAPPAIKLDGAARGSSSSSVVNNTPSIVINLNVSGGETGGDDAALAAKVQRAVFEALQRAGLALEAA